MKSKPEIRYETIPLEHRDCERWPAASLPSREDLLERHPLLSLDEAEMRANEMSERFERLSRGIRAYLVNGSLKQALHEARCHKATFYRQLERCLMPASFGGSIVGWPALIQGFRIKGYERVNEGTGTAGQFRRWLRENPRWREILDHMIRQGNGGQRLAAEKPTRRGITANFISRFKKDIPLGVYPHDGRDNARGAIDRYIKEFVAIHLETTGVWFGDDVAQKQHLGTGPQSFNLAVAPFDVSGTDAHTVDALGTVIVPGPAGPQLVPVDRIQIVVNLCQDAHAIIGYSVCIRRQIQALHVEEAYRMGMTPWKPKQLTITGLRYDENAGFPCGSIEGVNEVNPALIRLDNASQHFSNVVVRRLRRSLGCGIGWGGVGHWWRNALTERFFGTLERYGFQRAPSSMGNGPQDPRRAANPVAAAVENGITWDELVQLIDVLLANYNAKPHTALGGRSPLDSIRLAHAGRYPTFFPRIRPPATANTPELGDTVLRRKIAGSVEHRTAPYVQIGETPYTNSTLEKRYDWLHRPVDVHVPQDMRRVKVYFATGEFLGILECRDKGWKQSPHSLEQRQAVNALIRSGELWVPSGGDPMVVWLDHLDGRASTKVAQSRQPRVNRDASAAADLQRTTGLRPSTLRPAQAAANTPKFQSRRRPGVTLPAKWQ